MLRSITLPQNLASRHSRNGSDGWEGVTLDSDSLCTLCFMRLQKKTPNESTFGLFSSDFELKYMFVEPYLRNASSQYDQASITHLYKIFCNVLLIILK